MPFHAIRMRPEWNLHFLGAIEALKVLAVMVKVLRLFFKPLQ